MKPTFIFGFVVLSSLFWLAFFTSDQNDFTGEILRHSRCPENDVMVLKNLEDEGLTRNIFFIDTSFGPTVTERTACAVESASKHNRDAQVKLLLSSSRVCSTDRILETLLRIPNVKVLQVDMEESFKDTHLDAWFRTMTWNDNSALRAHHLSDGLRVALVYRYGGTYLDSDIISLAPLPAEDAWLARQHDTSISNGAFRMPARHWFCREVMEDLKANYDGYKWSNNGPDAFTRVISKHCQSLPVLTECRNMTIKADYIFYKISGIRWKEIFNASFGPKLLPRLNESVGLHLWNSVSHNLDFDLTGKSLFIMVAKANCPAVYRVMMDRIRNRNRS